MGHKLYSDEEPKRPRIAEFFESFFAAFMAFSSCIGGWLVHFGMPVMWMFALTIVVALMLAIKISEK